MSLEIACFNADSAILASEAGVDRIELCDNAHVGGTTPPVEWLTELQHKVHVPINVMIRPRGGDFIYTDEEFQSMKEAMSSFKISPMVSGFVFGILKEDRSIDIPRNKDLVKLAAPLPCTFHRAFDETEDPIQALQDVVHCGIKTILSSGGAPNAVEGCALLAQLVKKAGESVMIMPGGGVRSANIGMLKGKTGALFYHSSALVDDDKVANDQEIRQMKRRLQQERRHNFKD